MRTAVRSQSRTRAGAHRQEAVHGAGGVGQENSGQAVHRQEGARRQNCRRGAGREAEIDVIPGFQKRYDDAQEGFHTKIARAYIIRKSYRLVKRKR